MRSPLSVLGRMSVVMALMTAFVAGQTCTATWAVNVFNVNTGSGVTGYPQDVLGNTSAWYRPGVNGYFSVDFGAPFTTSGNGTIDLYVEEYGTADCYWVCLSPNDAYTQNAVQAAGLQYLGSNLYRIPHLFCGTQSIDLDAEIPGHGLNQLKFASVMVEDDGSGNKAEFARIRADFVCTVTPPPVTCVPGFATTVVGSYVGSNQNGTPPTNALGDTTSSFQLGSGGWITLAFAGPYTTSGDGDWDIVVFESGNDECYWVCLRAADAATQAVLAATGWNNSNGLYQIPQQFCGNCYIDIDAYLPGFNGGVLSFSEVMIEDDGGGNGAEIKKVQAKFVCPPPPPSINCGPSFATEVTSSVQGPNAITGDSNPQSVLGDTGATRFSLGQGGCVSVGFGNLFTTTGDNGRDLFIDEWNNNDCFFVGLKAANGATETLMQNAGFVPLGGGFYAIPSQFCGDANIDIDAALPGNPGGFLRFSEVMVKDDGAPSGDNGAEVERILADLVCDYACIGDRIWVDLNSNGVQDAFELSVPEVSVRLLDATGTTVLDEVSTGFTGTYKFYVAPGTYVVEFVVGNSFTFTAKGQGGDPTRDSNANVATGRSDPVTVGSNEVNLTIDAGVILNCVGPLAINQLNLPACALPQDPFLNIIATPTPGELGRLQVIAPAFPNSLTTVFVMAGPPQTFQVNLPNNVVCNIHVDTNNLVIFAQGFTDANGLYEIDVPIPAMPGLLGFDVTLQARVCDPTQPGPIPGFPDWLSTGAYLKIGCP